MLAKDLVLVFHEITRYPLGAYIFSNAISALLCHQLLFIKLHFHIYLLFLKKAQETTNSQQHPLNSLVVLEMENGELKDRIGLIQVFFKCLFNFVKPIYNFIH